MLCGSPWSSKRFGRQRWSQGQEPSVPSHIGRQTCRVAIVKKHGNHSGEALAQRGEASHPIRETEPWCGTDIRQIDKVVTWGGGHHCGTTFHAEAVKPSWPRLKNVFPRRRTSQTLKTTAGLNTTCLHETLNLPARSAKKSKT